MVFLQMPKHRRVSRRRGVPNVLGRHLVAQGLLGKVFNEAINNIILQIKIDENIAPKINYILNETDFMKREKDRDRVKEERDREERERIERDSKRSEAGAEGRRRRLPARQRRGERQLWHISSGKIGGDRAKQQQGRGRRWLRGGDGGQELGSCAARRTTARRRNAVRQLEGQQRRGAVGSGGSGANGWSATAPAAAPASGRWRRPARQRQRRGSGGDAVNGAVVRYRPVGCASRRRDGGEHRLFSRKVVNGIMHQGMLPKDGKIIRINHSTFVDKFLDALLNGSSFQTAVKVLSLSVSYGGKQHVPLSLLTSHAQKAMEVILKSSVDRAAVQCSCDELNGETIVCLPAFMHIKQKGDPSFLASRFVLECLGHLPFEVVVLLLTFLLSGLRALTNEAPLILLHACDKNNERLMLHGIGFSLDIPKWVAKDFFMSTDASMARESVGAHASEYQSHSRHRHIQCEGLEMIRGKRGLDGRGKEINLRAYCVSTMCGVYGASVRWFSAELR
ncbi:hypothetical protein Scep_003971 [Stephania cephalantha]|uniref:Uncharacterized protein n=1 Tax=Stephania cephalantha TaxID=152367 RepID=A0AAP0KTF2_9MAGN